MPRAGLSAEAVVELAVELVDEDVHGPGGLTLAAVAARAGVATPSLYKHVGSLAELRSLVSLRGWRELTARVADAVMGRSGEDALRGLLLAYRSYVVEHPNRYRGMHQAPLTDPRTAAVADRLMGIVLAVLGGFGLPGDLDASFELLVSMLVAGLRTP